MKRVVCALTALCMAGTLTACGLFRSTEREQETQENAIDLGEMPKVTVPDIEIPSMTVPEIEVTAPNIDFPDMTPPEFDASDGSGEDSGHNAAVSDGTIKDESGEFTYSGALRQIGDDAHGYIRVPANFVNYKDVDVDDLVQASDQTGKNIVTVTHYASIDYETLANSMRAQLESDTKATGLTGAKVAPNGYEGLQVYCYYPDDKMFLVAWAVKDPADEKGSYFLTLEFDSDHQYLMACSSTLQTPEDYHKENG